MVALGGAGCSLGGLLNSDDLPPDVSDPALTQTAEGARRAYNGVLAQFRTVFGGNNIGSAVVVGGLLGDELEYRREPGEADPTINRRNLPEASSDGNPVYSALQRTRTQAGQAVALLTRHLPEEPALSGRLHALQGYTEVFLAELFCSGIPLSTLDYDGDYTYQPGSSTAQVLTHAVALFDTALTLASDSGRFVELARVGRARALLGLGEYAAAAAAVATVPDGYRYTLDYYSDASNSLRNFASVNATLAVWEYSVPDREGTNGLAWRTSGDPRTPTVPQSNSSGHSAYYPSRYATNGATPLVVASGVEARLIEAEAQLHANPDDGAWLATLNALRTDGTQTSGVYTAGSGGVAGLAPLADPGTEAARVDLLFQERAFWLFLTGHRQGDLRRLLRQYGRVQEEIYPVGPYAAGAFPYGSDVTLPIPPAEAVNPLFTGCISRGE